jgi:tripartite-type tricarboxylate transporter receptor subunit TctC
LKDFAPVSLVGRIPLVFAAHPSFPANSIPELVKMAKARPGSLTYGSVGAGSSGHLAAEQLKLLAGIDLLHVPYKGGAPALTALMGEQVHLIVFAAGAAVPHMKAGRVKGLAVTGVKRSPAMPGVPTMVEAGYPQLDSGAWMGVVAPAGTPAPVIARLHSEIAKATKDPAMAGKLADQAVELVGSSPEEFGAFIRSEYDKWGKLIRDAKLNIEQ